MGMKPKATIRSNRSILANNDPLNIVDAIHDYDIDHDGIGAVDVSKDASSIAIYRFRCSKAVIIITTKKD